MSDAYDTRLAPGILLPYAVEVDDRHRAGVGPMEKGKRIPQ